MRQIIFLSLLALLLVNCEDPIDVPSQFEAPQVVVDAWLDIRPQAQTIILNETVPYFEGGTPGVIADASVQLCRTADGQCFSFAHQGEGNYVWEPNGLDSLGSVGDELTLTIDRGEDVYISTVLVARTAVIDSISFEFEEESLIFDEGFYGQVYARDWPGRGDTYLIRAWRNDTLLNRPTEITTVYDATFDPGADVDGVYFIPPLRASINSSDDDGAPLPFLVGDTSYVEVHSINGTAFEFYQIAVEQITNSGIFAVPLANSPSNVINQATREPIRGIFNVAAVSSKRRILTE